MISSGKSRVALYVVPTNEELMIAKHSLALLQDGRAEMSTAVAT
jgi:acetate kinase